MDPSRIFAYVKAIELANAGPAVQLAAEDDLLVQGFVGRLVVTLAHDDGVAFTLLQRRHLDQLAMSEAEAFDLGRQNLQGLLDAGQVRLHASGGGYAVIAGGNLEASTLVLPDMWSWVCDHIGASRLLAAAPARDIFFVVNADNPDGHAAIDALLARVADNHLDHALTPDRYFWNGTRWDLAVSLDQSPATEN